LRRENRERNCDTESHEYEEDALSDTALQEKRKGPIARAFSCESPPKEIVRVEKLRYFFFAGAFFAGFFAAAFFCAIATSSVIQLVNGVGQSLENSSSLFLLAVPLPFLTAVFGNPS
jgi:hypothetical protein